MRDFLTLKTGHIPKVKEVYEEFKKYVQSREQNYFIESLLKEIHTYSEYYTNFALLIEKYSDLFTAFQDIKTIRVEVYYLLILELYIYLIERIINIEDFIQIL